MAEKKYTIGVDGGEFVVVVDRLGTGLFSARLADGRRFEVSVAEDGAQAVQPVAGPSMPAAGGDAPASGAGVAQAPLPGVVLSVEVAVGAQVARGDTLVVLEAMKMKNEVKAEIDGVVARVAVGVGDQVGHGDVLVELEAGR